MNIVRCLTMAVLFTIMLLPVSAFGDGCFIWRNRDIDILQPEQKAVIEWDGKTEKLTIETKYKGPADEMVWIVPVPAKPEVKRADLRVFEEMSRWTQDPQVSYTRFGPAARSAAAPSPLISRKKVGTYDVAVLAPNMSAAVVKWLQENQFPVSDAATRTIADYDSRNWYIIAARINLESLTKGVQGQLAEGTLHPLAVSFETDRCVYPMRMTSLAAGPVEVLLWVKAAHHYQPETLASPEWNISFHGGPAYAWGIRRSLWEPLLQDKTRPTECITKLRRTFDPNDIAEDLYLKEADYASFFDPTDTDRVGMVATQWGLWKDTQGIPLLADYLLHAKIEDKPHIRSAIWALGECSAGGKMPDAAENLLLKIAQTDAQDLGMECCVALEKVGARGVGPLILNRMEKLLEALLVADYYSTASFRLCEDRMLLAEWFHRHRDSDIRRKYLQVLGRQIGRLTEAVKDTSTKTHKADLFCEFGVWLVREAAGTQDASFIAPLTGLCQANIDFRGIRDKRTIAAEATFMQVALAACHDRSAKSELLGKIQTELGTLEQKFLATPPEDIVSDNNSGGMFAYISGVFKEGSLSLPGPFDTSTEIACRNLPPTAREEIAAELLRVPNIPRYCNLYLLGWLTHPETSHLARLKAIWSASAQEESKLINVPATLALKVAEKWQDAELMEWMLLQTPQLDLKEQCLTALVKANPVIAATALPDLVPAWNAKCSTANKFRIWVHPDNDFSGYQRNEDLKRAVLSGLQNDDFCNAYRKICSDETLHPATRYYLLDLLGISKRPAWSAPLAEAVFGEAAANASQDDYKGLVRLLHLSDCNKRLASEWATVKEDWKKDELAGALILARAPEAVDVLEKMLMHNWFDQFKGVKDGSYGDFSKKLLQSLQFGTGSPELTDVIDRVVRDEKMDIGYRACIACVVPVLSADEMKEMTSKDIPDSIRQSLQSKVKQMEERASKEGPPEK